MDPTLHSLQAVLGLLVAVALFATFSRRLRLPYPSVLALGGLCLALIPGLPRFQMPPDLVLLVFLPPLMFSAGWRISWRELTSNVRPISLLAIGLVLFTTVGVAVIAHALDAALPIAAALVLGAIVSPTDALAASAVARQVHLPHRLVTILECESVANDATGLVVYRLAVAAVVSGAFSPARAAGSFIAVAVGGAVVGLAAGWLSLQLQRRIDDPPVEIALQLLTGYAAYLPAELLGLSGVFAAATAGVFCGHHGPTAMASRTRLQAVAFWDTLEFLLNAVLFLLLGLQLPVIAGETGGTDIKRLIGLGLLVSAGAIALRMAWVYAATVLPRVLSRSLRKRDPMPPGNVIALLGWAGMRGVLSLATALALPRAIAGGAPFPGRAHIVFFAFVVIVVTLVVQGLSLPGVVRLLRVKEQPPDDAGIRVARLATANAARDHLVALQATDDLDRRGAVASLLRRYQRYAEHVEDEPNDGGGSRRREYVRLRRELAALQRAVLIDLHKKGAIGDEAQRLIEHELDLEEQRQ